MINIYLFLSCFMIRCQRHTQRRETAMPRHQRDRQTTAPCPSIAALTRHAEELMASALAPVETDRNQRHTLDSDLHSLQAQQRQALDPNNKRYHFAAGLPSSDHEGILVCARCYSRYFISELPQRACHTCQ